MVSLDNADVVETFAVEFFKRLIDEFDCWHNEQHAQSHRTKAHRNRGRDQRFATASRKLNYDSPYATRDCVSASTNCLRLIGAHVPANRCRQQGRKYRMERIG